VDRFIEIVTKGLYSRALVEPIKGNEAASRRASFYGRA
jgi:hypothetical protein